MNSLSKYEREIFFSVFFIVLSIIGSIFFAPPVFSYRPLEPWQIPPDKWDVRLLRNYAHYLVEGKAGLGTVLGENEKVLFSLWGAPTYRDYGTPEKLFYKTQKFEGSFILKKGRIIEIRYHVSNIQGSLKWRSALGLWQEDIENLSKEECIEALKKHYKNVRYTRVEDGILIQNRGILFLFDQDRMREIRIFRPYRFYKTSAKNH